LGSNLLTHSFNELAEVKIYGPNVMGDNRHFKFHTGNYNFKVTASNCEFDIMKMAESRICTADATFHTWPDETGKFKIYLSKSSQTARFKFKQPEPTTMINRNNIKEAQHWSDLKHYIDATTAWGIGPQRKDVCDLVKQISSVKVDAAQERELIKMGVDSNPYEIDLDEDNT
jgi:hypothetical protein